MLEQRLPYPTHIREKMLQFSSTILPTGCSISAPLHSKWTQQSWFAVLYNIRLKLDWDYFTHVSNKFAKTLQKLYSGHVPAPIHNMKRLLTRDSVCWRYCTSRLLLRSSLSTNFITGCSHDDDSLSGNRDNDRCLVTSSLPVGVTSSPRLHVKYVSSRQRETLTSVTSPVCHDIIPMSLSLLSISQHHQLNYATQAAAAAATTTTFRCCLSSQVFMSYSRIGRFAFSALTLLDGRHEEHPACKKLRSVCIHQMKWVNSHNGYIVWSEM